MVPLFKNESIFSVEFTFLRGLEDPLIGKRAKTAAAAAPDERPNDEDFLGTFVLSGPTDSLDSYDYCGWLWSCRTPVRRFF